MQKKLELTEEELARVARRKQQDEKTKVSPEELFISEFGLYFGWQGVKALMDNEIDMHSATTLVAGVRKVKARDMTDLAMAVFTASAAAQSGKKAQSVLSKGLREFIKQSKADL